MVLVKAPLEPYLYTFAYKCYPIGIIVQVNILKYVNVFSIDLPEELAQFAPLLKGQTIVFIQLIWLSVVVNDIHLVFVSLLLVV